MEFTRENLNVLRNMKKNELLNLVVHIFMRIAEEKNLIEYHTVISDLSVYLSVFISDQRYLI